MPKKDSWIFIINPVAGNGFAGRYADTVRTMISRRDIRAEIVFTSGIGDAARLADKYARKGVRNIIGVGGDGTFSEIVRGIVSKKGVVFGAIPAGTGNDFINITGFSERFTETDWDIFFERHVTGMDVGRCNDRYFINGMGLGFDAQVASENYNSQKGSAVKRGSKAKYWWHIIKTILTYRERDMKLYSHGTIKNTRSFLNTIANGRRLAGGFYLTPKAFANDRLLDICMISELSIPGRIRELVAVIRQTHLEDRVVNYFQTDRFSLEFPGEVPAHLDGELYFNSRFDISVIPSGVRIIFNPLGAHYFTGIR